MSEIRGVWIANRPHSQVLESQDNISEAIAFLDSYGFNYIFPVVWTRGYTIYPSGVMSRYYLPAIDPFYAQQQRDPLGEIITAAYQRDMKVIPWLEYGFAASHLLNGGHILKQYPHWQAVDRNGDRVRYGSLTWMNGFNPQVQQFMLDLVAEIVTNYDVDGIQGCDRLPALPNSAGYDPDTVDLYKNTFSKHPPQNPQDKHWIQWRADLLTDFLAELYQQVKTIKPDAIVSLSPGVYPFCLQYLLQDSPAWIAKGLADIIHPQIYRSNHFSYNQEVKKIIKTFDRHSLSKFAPGIAFTANGKDITPKDLIKCIETNRDRSFGGQVFFHYEGLRKNNDRLAIALADVLWANGK
ncbi:family 10 glycosylhydrolase [Waterburya agarophytonicola K14]|uniref:Family 10 glycosylhydrolase n=1 Tax=Waterburya agarophytonicola KI4 TaxID=2874699 RepID=A0A964FES0_9CYAN|nr:family 10 glycosylhydrolase [Waterburya agarophytonicola]MCC0177010.1 family 10 glycosylhydrolase [Waterburya agarophytonicola KI4]